MFLSVIILIYLATRDLIFIAEDICRDIPSDTGVIERDQDSHIKCLGMRVYFIL